MLVGCNNRIGLQLDVAILRYATFNSLLIAIDCILQATRSAGV